MLQQNSASRRLASFLPAIIFVACAAGATEIDRSGITGAGGGSTTSGSGGSFSNSGAGGSDSSTTSTSVTAASSSVTSSGGGGGDGGGDGGGGSSATATGSGGSSSTTSGSGSGGSGGTGSTTSTSSTTGAGGSGLVQPGDWIDDLEDGNGDILVQGGRQGGWYTYNDGTMAGMQHPKSGDTFLPKTGGHTSQYAAATQGSGFIGWGAGFGFDFKNTGINALTRQPYDVTGFTGFLFWIKGTTTKIRVSVLSTDVVPPTEGGTCSTLCNDAHGLLIDVTNTWTEHVVPFSMLKQEGWGTPETLAPPNVLSILFQTAAAVPFDHRVDDVGLY